MNLLCYLYPQSWRRRYGREFAALLDARVLTLTDVIDAVLGAFDAHMNPQPSYVNRKDAPRSRLTSSKSKTMSKKLRELPTSNRLATIALIAVTPILLFEIMNISAYSLGVTFLRDLVDPMLSDPDSFRVFSAVTPFVFIGGPLLALALSIIPIMRIDLRAEAGQLVGTVAISGRAFNIVTAAASVLALAILTLYMLGENRREIGQWLMSL